MIIKSSQVGINVTVKNRERTFPSLPTGSCSNFKWYFASKSTLMKALALSEGYPGKQLRRIFFSELRKRIFFLTICIRRKSGRNNFSFYVEGKTVWLHFWSVIGTESFHITLDQSEVKLTLFTIWFLARPLCNLAISFTSKNFSFSLSYFFCWLKGSLPSFFCENLSKSFWTIYELLASTEHFSLGSWPLTNKNDVE